MIIKKDICKQQRKQLEDVLKNADWLKYSSLATNSCHHIGKSDVYRLLKDSGFEE